MSNTTAIQTMSCRGSKTHKHLCNSSFCRGENEGQGNQPTQSSVFNIQSGNGKVPKAIEGSF